MTPIGSLPIGGSLSSLATLTPSSGIMNPAFRIAGILSEAGRGPSVSEQTEAFDVLNTMIDAQTIERLMTWAVTEVYIPIVAGQQTYTIGTTTTAAGPPDILAPRPVRIDQAGLYFSSDSNPPVEVALDIYTYQQWQSVSPKGLTCTIPSVLYYQADIPNGTIFLWPIPTDASNQFTLYLWQVLTGFASPTQQIYLPPAYLRMLRYNLARELAQIHPRRQKMSPESYMIADSSKRQIKAANDLPLMMQVEAGDTGVQGTRAHWSIFSNTYTPNN